jgi:hypothetical protein
MARKIAESDRNNEIYRKVKKGKELEMEKVKRNK